jgi:hypothetical protein
MLQEWTFLEAERNSWFFWERRLGTHILFLLYFIGQEDKNSAQIQGEENKLSLEGESGKEFVAVFSELHWPNKQKIKLQKLLDELIPIYI